MKPSDLKSLTLMIFIGTIISSLGITISVVGELLKDGKFWTVEMGVAAFALILLTLILSTYIHYLTNKK